MSLGKKPVLFNGEILKISETTALDKVTFLLIMPCLGRWEGGLPVKETTPPGPVQPP